MDGYLEARQAGNPTVENDFPPLEMVSHRGNWYPTVGNNFLIFSLIMLKLHFGHYAHFADLVPCGRVSPPKQQPSKQI